MNAKTSILILIFSLFTVPALAGTGFEVSLGMPSAAIKNPDGGTARYGGVALGGKLILPIFEGGNFQGDFNFAAKYLDLQNTANSGDTRESGNHIGAGLGFSFQFGKFVLGADYMMMKARHLFVGDVNSQYVEYSYSPLSIFGGLRFDLGQALNMGFSYEMVNSAVPGEALDLTSDSDYSETTLWLHLTYKTGASTGEFVKKLFN